MMPWFKINQASLNGTNIDVLATQIATFELDCWVPKCKRVKT